MQTYSEVGSRLVEIQTPEKICISITAIVFRIVAQNQTVYDCYIFADNLFSGVLFL